MAFFSMNYKKENILFQHEIVYFNMTNKDKH